MDNEVGYVSKNKNQHSHSHNLSSVYPSLLLDDIHFVHLPVKHSSRSAC